MDQRYRSLRAGITAVLFALFLRLWEAGTPEFLLQRLSQPNKGALESLLETGRSVRFSPSFGGFSPWFVESSPAAAPADREPERPAFSDGEAAKIQYLYSVETDPEALLSRPLQWDLRKEAPAVLILHTHSTESYTRQGEAYAESAPWRTLDKDYNMLSVGERVAELLTDAGIGVIQDRQLHDHPSYNGSYAHARQRTAELLAQNPSIKLVLDLHRDASSEGGGQLRPLAQGEGKTCAGLMLVVGAGHGAYEENLSLALKLHAQLQRQMPGIMRPLQLRSGRFNQDLGPCALLVEVGAAGNTHPEALAAAEELARAVIALSRGTG